MVFRLKETDIVRVSPSGDITLTTGGWYTVRGVGGRGRRLTGVRTAARGSVFCPWAASISLLAAATQWVGESLHAAQLADWNAHGITIPALIIPIFSITAATTLALPERRPLCAWHAYVVLDGVRMVC